MKSAHFAKRIISWIPLISFLCLATFTAVVCLKVGGWPSYGRPAPGVLRLPILYGGALLAYPAAFLAIIVGLIGLALEPEAWRRRDAKIFFVGAFLWALSVGPAAGLISWLMD